jgi:Cu2+-containing amine oxidase
MSKFHPLDPLIPAEISATSKIIREAHPRNWIFNTITLLEPPKYEVLKGLNSIPRKSVAMLIEKVTGDQFEAIVNLTETKVESLAAITDPEAHLNLSSEDCINAERIILEDENVKARCARLGFPDMNLIIADAW